MLIAERKLAHLMRGTLMRIFSGLFSSTLAALTFCFAVIGTSVDDAFSSVQVEVAVDYLKPDIPPIVGSDVKIAHAPNFASETVTAHGNIATATANISGDTFSLNATSVAEVTTLPGSNSYAGAGARAVVTAGQSGDGVLYAVTGVWAVAGEGVAWLWPTVININSPVGTSSWTAIGGTQLEFRVTTGAGNQVGNTTGAAALIFAIHPYNVPAPPLPGRDPNAPERMFASMDGIDIRTGDDNTIVSPAIPITGTYNSPVFDEHGRTLALYFGTPATGGISSLALSSAASLEPTAVVTAYRYRVTENLFTHFVLPFSMPAGDSELQVEVDGQIVPYTPGTLFDFTTYVPGGVSEFFLSGINIEEGFLLDEVLPFVSGLRFAQNGIANLRISPADIAVLVPEPSTNFLVLIGTAVMLHFSRRLRGLSPVPPSQTARCS